MHDRNEMLLDILAPLALHYPQAGYTPAQLHILADDWCEDLAAYPMPLLRNVLRNLRRRERYFPCVATMLDYAAAAAQESAMTAHALPSAARSPDEQRELNLQWTRRILDRQAGNDPHRPDWRAVVDDCATRQ